MSFIYSLTCLDEYFTLFSHLKYFTSSSSSFSFYHLVPAGSSGKEPAHQCKSVSNSGLILGSGRSPGGGRSNSIQDSCLENPLNRGAWWATVNRVANSQTWMKRLSTHRGCFTGKIKVTRKKLPVLCLGTCYHLVSYGGCFFVTKVGLIMILFNAKHFSHSTKFISSYLSSASLQIFNFIPVSLFSLSAASLLWDIVLLICLKKSCWHSHSIFLLYFTAKSLGSIVNIFPFLCPLSIESTPILILYLALH